MQMTNAPTAPSKFLHLKYLCIHLYRVSPAYDYFSLASFFDASPSLETFRLNVSHYSIWQYTGPGRYSEPLNLICFTFSATAGTHGAWLDFWRFLRSEADATTLSSQPPEIQDHRFWLCKELGWANMLYSWEHAVTQMHHARHHFAGSFQVFWQQV